MSRIFFFGHQVAAVLTYVFEIQEEVERNNQQIEQIQINDPIIIVEDLVQDSENIAQNNDGHEDRAFTKNHFSPQGFYNGKGPAASEAQQHQYLKNADIHCFILIFRYEIKQREDTFFCC